MTSAENARVYLRHTIGGLTVHSTSALGSLLRLRCGMVAFVLLGAACVALSQTASWLYPLGNSAAHRSQPVSSAPQNLSAFQLKWFTTAIAGDLFPLAGNIIRDTAQVAGVRFDPLELAAVVGGQLVVIDGYGHKVRRSRLPAFARAVSCIADSALLPPALQSRVPSVLFLETAEAESSRDSIATAFIAAYDPQADTVTLVARLTYDLRPYAPNLFAWVRPVFAASTGTSIAVYSALGTTAPRVGGSSRAVPYLRGLAVTRALPAVLGGTFPIPDVGDNVGERFSVAPHVGFEQSSIAPSGAGSWMCYLPCTPAADSATVTNSYGSSTDAQRTYLLGARFAGGFLSPLQPTALDTFLSAPSMKPVITPRILDLRDGGRGGQPVRVILVAETYLGRDGSSGRAQLHLFAADGSPLTSPQNTASPPFRGGMNHSWSIAVGDVDGTASNELLPYYPNNPGAEIICTASSRDLAVAGSRLMILRYRSGAPVPKPTPAGAVLAPLDTIVTFPITGWVAAVADLDSAADGKAEIVLVDRSELLVLRLRDYADPRFRTGAPFDTAYRWQRSGETITNVAVADLDGDGRHDLVVTTNGGTYVLGVPIPQALRVVAPQQSSSFCTRDTITVAWRYLYGGEHRFSIAFQPYVAGIAAGAAQVIVRDSLISGDTLRIRIPARLLPSNDGRFVVWLASDSSQRDSSSAIARIAGQLRFDTAGVQPRYVAGTFAVLAGQAVCIDSLRFEGSLDGGRSWQQLPATATMAQGQFLARVTLPCIPFPALGGSDTLLLVRAVGVTTVDTAVSDTLRLRLAPAAALLEVAPTQPGTPCCEYSVALVSAPAPCVRAAVYVRYQPTGAWTLIDSAAQSSTIIPPRDGSSDTLHIRWACRGSCVRVDTAVVIAPRLIEAIAPNPVARGVEECRIITTPRSDGRITIRIFDQSDRLIRTLVRDEPRRARQQYCDRWDCRSDSGELVPPGMYYVVVCSSNGWETFEAVYVR